MVTEKLVSRLDTAGDVVESEVRLVFANENRHLPYHVGFIRMF